MSLKKNPCCCEYFHYLCSLPTTESQQGRQNQQGRAQRLICLRIQRSIVRRLSIIARSSGLVTIESGNSIQRLRYEIPSPATFLSFDWSTQPVDQGRLPPNLPSRLNIEGQSGVLHRDSAQPPDFSVQPYGSRPTANRSPSARRIGRLYLRPGD